MSFYNCIEAGKDVGAIGQKQADEALRVYEDLFTEYSKTMNESEAAALASKDAIFALEKNANNKVRIVNLQKRAIRDVNKNLVSFNNGKDLGKAAINLLESQADGAKFSGLEDRYRAVFGMTQSMMSDVLATFGRRGVFGTLGDKAAAIDLVNVAHGKKTKNLAAKELYEAWEKSSEYLRKTFNKYGGDIPKSKNWFPTNHDAELLLKSTRDEWVNFIRPLLNITEMKSPLTGKPLTEKQLTKALNESYDAITTDGWSKVKEGQGKNQQALYNKGKQSKFLIFKDGDAWVKYQDRFGNSHPFISMMQHLDSMSRDIATIQILGPNPNATIKNIKDTVQRVANTAGPKETKAAKIDLNTFDNVYDLFTGKAHDPVNATIANIGGSTRNILTAAQLGSSFLVAFPIDLATTALTAAFNKSPQVKTLSSILKAMNPLTAKERTLVAVRSGLIAENWIALASSQARYVGEISGTELSKRIADVVLRASLLSPWTQAGRMAAGIETMGAFADVAKLPFNKLDSKVQNLLKRNGLDIHWDVIRKSPIHNKEGVSILRPAEILESKLVSETEANIIATRYLEMINKEINFAIPSVSLTARQALTGNVKSGTLVGEVVKSFAQYKNFPMQIYYTHIRRGLNEDTITSKSKYLGFLIASTTMMGAAVIQMQEIAKGRDPKSMQDPSFWVEALEKGGGLSLAGDILLSDINRYGGGIESLTSGPAVEFGSDVTKLTLGNIYEALAGEETKIAQESVEMVKKFSPGKSIWYTKLATERLLFDSLQEMADPKAMQKIREKERKLKKETGQKYWWSAKDKLPKRAPDLGTMLDEAPR
jgi:hypothetical protein